MQGCRQADKAEIAPAPGSFVELPAYLVEVLAVVRLERELDRIEWECVEGL